MQPEQNSRNQSSSSTDPVQSQPNNDQLSPAPQPLQSQAEPTQIVNSPIIPNPAKSSRSKSKLIILLIAVVVIALCVGAVLYVRNVRSSDASNNKKSLDKVVNTAEKTLEENSPSVSVLKQIVPPEYYSGAFVSNQSAFLLPPGSTQYALVMGYPSKSSLSLNERAIAFIRGPGGAYWQLLFQKNNSGVWKLVNELTPNSAPSLQLDKYGDSDFTPYTT